jgi:catalase
MAVCVVAGCNSGASDGLGVGAERIGNDEAQIAAKMTELIQAIGFKRYPQGVMGRFNQTKSVACVRAGFQINDALPTHLRQGLFAKAKRYDALIRFANASKSDDREKDLRGMSIKVQGVPGDALWGANGTQDFILNSYPALFAGTPEDFLSFIEAVDDDRLWRYFINPLDPHLKSLWILFKARQRHASPFDVSYFSTTPYRFGSDAKSAVKYAVRSCSPYRSRIPDDPSANFLRQAMQQHLQAEPACMEFMVQFQTDAQSMPIEDASVIWDEAASPFVPVARITVLDQDFSNTEAIAECETVSFNPWQSVSEHQPLGGINRVRKTVYAELAGFRQSVNAERGFIEGVR